MEHQARFLLQYFENHICEFQIRAIDNQTVINDYDSKIAAAQKRIQSENKASELALMLDQQASLISDYAASTCDLAYDAINEYYSELERAGQCLPRVCIKSLIENGVIDFFRIQGNVEEQKRVLELTENSSFEIIFKNEKTSFISVPDIPRMAASKNNTYKNSRLDELKVVHYIQQNEKYGFNERRAAGKISNCDDENTYFDKEWSECFLSRGTDDQRACYKSTLVFAILLDGVTHPISLDCKRLLKRSAHESNRFVFGYLCFDHMLEDFFDEEIDYSIGAIFADLISIPFAIQSACLHNSKNFENALNLLAKKYSHILDEYTALKDLHRIFESRNADLDQQSSTNKKQSGKKKSRDKPKGRKAVKKDAKNTTTYKIKIGSVQQFNAQDGENNQQLNILIPVELADELKALDNQIDTSKEGGEKALEQHALLKKELESDNPESGKIKGALDYLSSFFNTSDKAASTIQKGLDIYKDIGGDGAT